MGNVFSKLKLGDKMSKNFLAILLIAASGTIIYGLPYFRYDYYDAYLQVYHLTNTQMGVFGSVLGIFGMISYLFGGIVADKFSIRTILSLSLIGTGVGGFIHLLPLNFTALVCLYAFWGVSSLFAFWPACIKAVRVLSDSDDQGKAFGWFEGARGVAAAIMAPLAVIVFQIGVKQLDDVTGMKYVIIFYSIITVLCGVLVLFKMGNEKIADGERLSFKDIGKVLRLPAVWIIGSVTFCNYVFTLSLYYFTPYATSILGATVTFGATLAAAKRWISPISNVGGGYLADRVGTGNLLLVSFLVMAAGTAGILLLPTNAGMIAAFTILFLISYFFYNVNYAMTWAMMDEGGIPEQYSGTAAGIISTVGYLPEIFCSLLAGILIDGYPGVTGYRYFFGFLIGVLLLGAICVLAWKKYLGGRHDTSTKQSEANS